MKDKELRKLLEEKGIIDAGKLNYINRACFGFENKDLEFVGNRTDELEGYCAKLAVNNNSLEFRLQLLEDEKMMKMLYELRDREDLVCYAYLVNEINGEVGQFLGKCIGYGLPASTQYSNPEKIIANRSLGQGGYAYGVLPQAEPNGLFMPEGLSATWLMMIDPKSGDPRPVYIEPSIIVSPFPLK